MQRNQVDNHGLVAISASLAAEGIRHEIVIAAARKKAVTLKTPRFDVPEPLTKSYAVLRKNLFPALPAPVSNAIKHAVGFTLDAESGSTIYMAELQSDVLECYDKIKPLFHAHPELEEFWNHLKKWLADYRKFVSDNGNFQPMHDE
jgi:hypothetical protein